MHDYYEKGVKMKETLNPLNTNERIHSLDMMRGFALLGILLVNTMNFQYGLFLIPSLHDFYPLGIFDQLTEGFLYLFIRTSFYTLFSFLFGYGMVILQERSKQKNRSFAAIYWRRALLLLLIGLLHRVYIWEGDILVSYALTSFLFFFFLRFQAKGLLISALIFLGIMSLSAIAPGETNLNDTSSEFYTYSVEEKEVLTNGSYVDVLMFRLHSDFYGLGILEDVFLEAATVLTVIGMFLLGAFVARKKWLIEVNQHKKLLKRIWWFTLLIGFGSKVPFLFSNSIAAEGLMTYIGGPLTAIFYATSISLLANTETGSQILKPFAYVGRLSLSQYLLQSLIFTTLFYGYGFSLFGKLGFFLGMLVSIAFFIIQILISKWYLNHFRIGPIEWLWRAGTYLSIPPFKKHK